MKVLDNKTLLERRMKGLSFDGVRPAAPVAPVGQVRGLGTGTSDSNLIAASDGEYVLPEATTDALGPENLDQLVRETSGQEPGGKPVARGLKGFAAGGYVDDFGDIDQRARMRVNQQAVPDDFGNTVRQAARPAGTPQPAAAPSAAPAQPSLSQRVAGAQQSVAEARAARAVPGTTPPARGLMSSALRGGAIAAPLTGFGDYQIDDPGVDSSAAGTLGNVAKGEFRQAWQGLKKGAVEAGLDSISGLAKVGDAAAGLVGAKPDLHGQFDRKVRESIGPMLKNNTGGSDRVSDATLSSLVAPPPPQRGLSATPSATAAPTDEQDFASWQKGASQGARDTAADAYRDAWQARAPSGMRGAGADATALYNAEQTTRGTGISAQRQPNGVMEFSGDGARALPQSFTQGIDMNLGNERMARANAIRQEQLDSQPGTRASIGNSAVDETNARFQASREQDAMKGLGRTQINAMMQQRGLDAQRERAQAELGLRREELASNTAYRSGMLEQQAQQTGIQRDRLSLDAKGTGLTAYQTEQLRRDDAKAQRDAAQRTEDNAVKAQDREVGQRNENRALIKARAGGDDTQAAALESTILQSRAAQLAKLRKEGGDPAQIAALEGPMTSDELETYLAASQVDSRLQEGAKSAKSQGLAAGLAVAGAGALAGAWKGLRTGRSLGSAAIGATAGGLAGAAGGGVSGSMNSPEGAYTPGDLNRLIYNTDGSRFAPQVRDGTIHFANGITAPLGSFDKDTLRAFGLQNPFAEKDAKMGQSLRALGARGLQP